MEPSRRTRYKPFFAIAIALLLGAAAFTVVRSAQLQDARAAFFGAADVADETHPDPITAPVLIQNMQDAETRVEELAAQRTYGEMATGGFSLVALVLFLLWRREARFANALQMTDEKDAPDRA